MRKIVPSYKATQKKVDEVNTIAKEEFKESFRNNIQEIVQNLDAYGAGHEEDCSKLQGELRVQLQSRTEHLKSLGETLSQLVGDQIDSVEKLNKMREEMKGNEIKFLEAQKEEVHTISSNRIKVVKDFQEMEVMPILKRIADGLLEQAEELKSLESSVIMDVENLVKTVNVFTVDVVENVSNLTNQVEQYATINEGRVKSLVEKNYEIQNSEENFKGLLESLMTSYAKHSKLVSESTKAIDKVTSEDVVASRTLVDSSKDITEKVKTSKHETLAKIDDENVRISTYVK